jgi:hypothetical protein
MEEASPHGNNNTVLQSGVAMKLINSDGLPIQGNDRWPLKVFHLRRLVLDDLGEFLDCHQDVGKSAASQKSLSGAAHRDSTMTAVAAFNCNSGLSHLPYDLIVQSHVE